MWGPPDVDKSRYSVAIRMWHLGRRELWLENGYSRGCRRVTWVEKRSLLVGMEEAWGGRRIVSC